MRSGSLRHSIDIESGKATSDGMGGETIVFTAISDGSGIRASIWPLRSTERLEAAKLELQITHRIRIRYRTGVTAAMRIKFNDPAGARYFNIRSIINNDEKNITLEFLAEEEI